ncbi:MAG: thrombospondin, partial [Nitrosopumilales archaeon]|nr:thrombospondin [Nitrosopumilales archaeon]
MNEIQTCSLAETGTLRLLCYSQLFSKMIEQEEKNIDTLQLALALTKLDALDDCHFVSHEIGHAAFRENPDVSQNMIGVDGKICRGGFYHGIMAAYFHNLKENNKDLVSYKTVCNDLIGTPDYTNFVHGLGHGLRHYYPDDLNASITACDQMSFYQGSVCMGGLLMQYTDEKLTQSRAWQNDISNICSRSELRDFDYQQCNDSLGLSLAFHTNHNYDAASKYCDLVSDEVGKESCFKGLEREIKDAKLYKEYDPTKGVRELFQPML